MKTLPTVLFLILVFGSLQARAEDLPVKFKGDVRYRHESLRQGDEDVNHRHRLRLRFSALSEINDQLELGFGVGSGDGDPVSTNQTLGEGFSKKPLVIDLAYFNYKPVKGLAIVGGKMKNPFYRPGDSQLVWDSDLTPEGLSVSYAHQFARLKLFATGVAYWIADRSGEEHDANLLGGQGGAGLKMGDFLLVAAGALYNYTNLIGFGPLYDDDPAGNTLDANRLYVNDYNILDAGLELRGKAWRIPFSVFGQLARNLAADSENTAFLAGFSVGEAKDRLGWRLMYSYRDVQRDAVVGTFSDSDFGPGGTGTRGHTISAEFSLNRNLAFGLILLLATLDDADDTAHNRLQVDMMVKF